MNKIQQQVLMSTCTQAKVSRCVPSTQRGSPAPGQESLGQKESEALRSSGPSLGETPGHWCCQWWLSFSILKKIWRFTKPCELSNSMLPMIQKLECAGQTKHTMQKNQPISSSATGVKPLCPTPHTHLSGQSTVTDLQQGAPQRR